MDDRHSILTVVPDIPARIARTMPPPHIPCHICGAESAARHRLSENPACDICYGLEVEAVSVETVPFEVLVARNHARAVHFGWRELATIEIRRREIARSYE